MLSSKVTFIETVIYQFKGIIMAITNFLAR